METLETGGFRFVSAELDGYKLIESIVPAKIDLTQLALSANGHYSLWDDETPTVTITDIRLLGGITGMARKVLVYLMKRNQARPSFRGSSWFYGDNDEGRAFIRDVLVEVGRPVESMFATRDECVEYLREIVARDKARAQVCGETSSQAP
jgi:hypothetical protein